MARDELVNDIAEEFFWLVDEAEAEMSRLGFEVTTPALLGAVVGDRRQKVDDHEITVATADDDGRLARAGGPIRCCRRVLG